MELLVIIAVIRLDGSNKSWVFVVKGEALMVLGYRKLSLYVE